MKPVERYLAAVAAQDWDSFAHCISDHVKRVGPFGDTYEGKPEYIAFLRDLMPTLAGYRMDVHRIVGSDAGGWAAAEITETMEIAGEKVCTRECLVFDINEDAIQTVTIYIQPPAARPPIAPT